MPAQLELKRQPYPQYYPKVSWMLEKSWEWSDRARADRVKPSECLLGIVEPGHPRRGQVGVVISHGVKTDVFRVDFDGVIERYKRGRNPSSISAVVIPVKYLN